MLDGVEFSAKVLVKCVIRSVGLQSGLRCVHRVLDLLELEQINSSLPVIVLGFV